jgi:hypothetical protein
METIVSIQTPLTTILKSAVLLPASLAGAILCTHAQAAYRVVDVLADSTKTYTYTADPGERFVVRVSGDGDTDVDLRVVGPNGRVACESDGVTDEESCSVYSRNGGIYRIEVINLGDIYNRVQVILV